MSNDNKLPDKSTDAELDKLLDSALADFDKISEPIGKKDEAPVSSISETDEKLTKEIAIDELWTHDFIEQTAGQFEKNLQSLIENGGVGGENEGSLQKMAQAVASAISSGTAADNSGEGSEFQATIAQALKDISITSGNVHNAKPCVTEADLAAMFGGASLDESGGDVLPFMQGMMQSLLSKEILYPALKDLVDKYPAWLDENKDTLPPKDLENVNKQLDCMKKVCAELEMEKDDDTDDVKKKRFDKILELMSELQTYGGPPADLAGDQTGLFQVDKEGNPTLPPGVDPKNCNIM